MQTYSFADVMATITGPGGVIPLGSGAGNAKEGITVAMVEDKDNMLIGADGQGMHSLHRGDGGSLTVRLLKTSPVNALLSAMFQFQKQSSAVWGQNVLVITDISRGDILSAGGVAFTKFPDIGYAEDGGTVEWRFTAIRIDSFLGPGALFAA